MAYGARVGEGKLAEVFEYGDGRVLKLYRAGQPASEARREQAILDAVEGAGIAAPRAFDLEQVEGRWGLVMTRVEGRPFAEAMRADPEGAGRYLQAMVTLQRSIHEAPGATLAPLRVRLARKLASSGLADPVTCRLRDRLASLPDGDRLLHGDYHPFNVLGTTSGPIAVDWLDATSGPPAADLCRSWLLIHSVSPTLADAYVALYLEPGKLSREAVFAWLPVLAAARLAETVPDEVDKLTAMANAG